MRSPIRKLPFELTDSEEEEESFADAMTDNIGLMTDMAKLLDDRLKSIATKDHVNQLMEKVEQNSKAVKALEGHVRMNSDEIKGIKLTVARLE